MSSENHDEVTALRELLAEQAERVGQLEGELEKLQGMAERVVANACMQRDLAIADRESIIQSRELVCAERDAFKAELDAIRAERERAQARLCGHPSYGEGAVADGPGTPQASDLRELAEGVAGLVAQLPGWLVLCSSCEEYARRIVDVRDDGSRLVCERCGVEEGAVADGPGAPQASDLRELAEGVAGLVGQLGYPWHVFVELPASGFALGSVERSAQILAEHDRGRHESARHPCGCEVGRAHECVGHGAG